LRRSLDFHPVHNLDEVLEVALVGGLQALEANGKPKKNSKRRKTSDTPARA